MAKKPQQEEQTAEGAALAVQSEITNYIRASYPVLYLLTPEEQRAEGEILEVAKSLKRNIKIWSTTEGFLEPLTGDTEQVEDPIEALTLIKNSTDDGIIFVFRDLHNYYRTSAGAKVVRLIRDIARDFKQAKKTLILISPVKEIPADVERDIVLIEFKLPTVDAVAKIFDGIYGANKTKVGEVNEVEREMVLRAALGLTTTECENAIAKAIVDRARTNGGVAQPISKLVMKEKAAAVKKTGILEFFEAQETLKGVGGLDNLKLWLDMRKKAFTKKAREFGLPVPRGILLVGLPGCGKSLSAKAASNALNVPLIRFDIGRVFGGLVGQSESNMRSAIQTIEALGDCVVWIDEMEKAFAGTGSSGSTDSGVSQRVFGNFITWMQEKKGAAFIVATVNRIESLPPELLRKGRFDEIFFVNLPSRSEREEIIKIHLAKRNRNPEDFDIGKIALETENFSGAEIEECVVSALFKAFYEDKDIDDKYVIRAAKETTPLSESAAPALEAMKKWAEKNAVNATRLEGKIEKALGRQLEF